MKWPMNKDLPEPQMLPTYAPTGSNARGRYGQDPRETWQLQAWREATGRDEPIKVSGPLMPPDEVGRVLMALGRKTLKGLTL